MDLRREGIDILDYHRGEVSPRRMDLFVRTILRDERSETFREIHGEIAQWSVERLILAELLNTVRILDYHVQCANAKDPRQVPEPHLMELPGVKSRPEQTARERFLAEMQAVPAADQSTVRAFASDNGVLPNYEPA